MQHRRRLITKTQVRFRQTGVYDDDDNDDDGDNDGDDDGDNDGDDDDDGDGDNVDDDDDDDDDDGPAWLSVKPYRVYFIGLAVARGTIYVHDGIRAHYDW